MAMGKSREVKLFHFNNNNILQSNIDMIANELENLLINITRFNKKRKIDKFL